MNDPNIVFNKLLFSETLGDATRDAALVSLRAATGVHIYGAPGLPMEFLDAVQAADAFLPAVSHFILDGTPEKHAPIGDVIIAAKFWDDPLEDARLLYGYAHDAFHGLSNFTTVGGVQVLSILAEDYGQDMEDPDLGWLYVLGRFRVMMQTQ